MKAVENIVSAVGCIIIYIFQNMKMQAVIPTAYYFKTNINETLFLQLNIVQYVSHIKKTNFELEEKNIELKKIIHFFLQKHKFFINKVHFHENCTKESFQNKYIGN